MERIQRTWKVVYKFTTGHDPIGEEDEVYVWGLNSDDAMITFRHNYNYNQRHINYDIESVVLAEPSEGDIILDR